MKHNIGYTPFAPPACRRVESTIKAIAFYLPQFYPISKNDEWWGADYTDWLPVTNAGSQFIGHYQPHIPHEQLGFYDLRSVRIQEQQIDIAKNYGIYGFCYHYFWFDGKTLFERPLQQLLDNPELDFPFCLCWFNEDWVREKGEKDSEVLIAQSYSSANDLAFIKSIEPAIRDTRYIKVDGRPLIIIHKPGLLPDPAATARQWREYCREVGIGEIHLVMAQTLESLDPRPYGFDAAMQFPPNSAMIPEITEKPLLVNSAYNGRLYNYRDLAQKYKTQENPEYILYRTVVPRWDNEPIKPGRGDIFIEATPALYQHWLDLVSDQAVSDPVNIENLVFINSWNEWREGSHLEPDRRHGFTYLNQTREVLKSYPYRNVTLTSLPLITVIVPIYNHEMFLEKTLNSVIHQSYPNIEIILVDDGSTDKSAEIAYNFQQHQDKNRVIFFQLKNSGTPRAIDWGVKHAQGEMLSICNSDDIFHQDRIFRLYEETTRQNSSLAFSDINIIDDKGEVVEDDYPLARKIRSSVSAIGLYPSLTYAIIDSNVAVSTGNLFFTKNLYFQLGGFSTKKYCHDWEFVIKSLKYAPPCFLSEKLYSYRIHTSNTFHSLQEESVSEPTEILEDFFTNDIWLLLKEDKAINLPYLRNFILERQYELLLKPETRLRLGI
jgi:glycosyltransferase involved in cell wall biosynthesis